MLCVVCQAVPSRDGIDDTFVRVNSTNLAASCRRGSAKTGSPEAVIKYLVLWYDLP